MTLEDKIENEQSSNIQTEETPNTETKLETKQEQNTSNIQSQKEDTINSEEISSKTTSVEEQKKEIIEIYTDGACSGNPGPGGYAAIILKEGECVEVLGGERHTTNNKMELMAAIEGLKKITNKESTIKLYTDSTYLQKGMTEWIANWKQKNYKDVKNSNLWQELDALNSNLNIEWHWVKAHAGNKYNEIADSLAKKEVDKNR